MPRVQLECFVFLHAKCLSKYTLQNFIDSKPLEVCHIKREKQHKVFDGLATKGKTSKGYFFGFKIHVICNQMGGIVKLRMTTGKTADNNHGLLRKLLSDILANVYGDKAAWKGYNSIIRGELEEKGTKLIANPKANMKKKQLTLEQKHFIRARGVIESIFEVLTHCCHMEHASHKSSKNFLVNLWTAFIAYAFKERKPSAII